ncbi:ImmA/IrrE family metallo-endopeptidase [Dactylosporangium sp. CA-139066]|uniref:ImmA/IrrE family metallo-endopeptidase n=1 Tax=Dactylosporangium sp. CA-139066 TaxID=3239930 RepID=UPI003D8F0B99
MCAINGCEKEGTTTVGEGEDSFDLCDEHADKELYPRTLCRCCRKAVRIADTPVRGNRPYGPPDDFRLCTKTCDLLPKDRCAGCRRIVRVGNNPIGNSSSYRDGKIRLCATCVGQVVDGCDCRACGAPAAYRTADGLRPLRDASEVTPVGNEDTVVGRRCGVCSPGSLNSRQEAQQYYDVVVQWMTGWAQNNGVAYPDYGNRLTWDVARDATFTTEAGGQTLGECVTKTRGNEPKRHEIQVLNFIRPIAFQRTLVHELTHAITNELNLGNHDKIEGFCNYVAYCFMRHIEANGQSAADQQEATDHIARMEANDDQEYGVNFRTIRDDLAQTPNGAIDWLR